MNSKPISMYVILFLSAVLWGGEYVRRDLWEPDEARFALVAREMQSGNHWLVPYRQGEFYSHKPPLMFWLINAFSVFTGGYIGNLAVRLPSFLGAVMTLWAASRLATRWFSATAGWWTVLLLCTSFLFWNKGGFGQIDALLCGLEMMALYHLFSANDTRSTRHVYAAYIFMGFAVLAKGPVGFLVPWGVYLAATAYSGEWHTVSRRHLILGPFITLLFPGVWLLLVWLQGAPEGYFTELLFKQNIERASGEFGGHQQPFYYFLKYFPLDFLPWTFLLPLSLAALARVPLCATHRRRLIAWIIFVIFFFSLSASKRNLYILLAYPAAAMVVAAGVEHWNGMSRRWLKNSFIPLWALFALLGSAMLISSFIPMPEWNTHVLFPGGAVMSAGSVGAWIYWRRNKGNAGWLAALSLSLLFAFTSIGALVYPEFNDIKTPDELVDVAQSVLDPDDRMILYKQNGEIYSLYSGRSGYTANSDEALVRRLIGEDQQNHLIVAYAHDLPMIYQIIDSNYPAVHFTMGSKELAWIILPGEPLLTAGYQKSQLRNGVLLNGKYNPETSAPE